MIGATIMALCLLVMAVAILIGMKMTYRHEIALKRMDHLHELDKSERERFSELDGSSASKNGTTIPPRPPVKAVYANGTCSYGLRHWLRRSITG